MESISLIISFTSILIIITGTFIYLFHRYINSERDRRDFELKLQNSQQILPNKLQAYERMVLFLERIKPTSLIKRVLVTPDLESYEYSLIETIQNEFDHNLAQQIYIYPETWKIIFSAKNATQLFIKEISQSMDKQATGKELQEEIIKQSLNAPFPSSAAILYLQKDIQKLG